ncbi:MAG: hypothetical protein PHS07_03310 [Patescibacteria group bacterium]|nr:hypothetical protein [Patescibacteria group bacterium]
MTVQPLVKQVTDQEVQGQAKELFEQIKQSTGSVPKWMRVMANCEDIMVGFFSLFKAVMDDTPLDRLLKWKVAYKISEMNKCEFCVSVSKQQLKQFGLKDEQIDKIDQPQNKREELVLKYAEAGTCHAYNIDPEVFRQIKEEFTDEEIVELTSVIGLFNFINRFNDALGILPDVK